jgi:hypothetical protein
MATKIGGNLLLRLMAGSRLYLQDYNLVVEVQTAVTEFIRSF